MQKLNMIQIVIAKGEATYRASDQTLVPALKDVHQQANEGELGNVLITPTTNTDNI